MPQRVVDSSCRCRQHRNVKRRLSRLACALCALFALGVLSALPARPAAAAGTPIQVYGAWHCGDDACTWAAVRDPADFDRANHWLIDRGDGSPSVNLVVLAFVNPLKLLRQTTDAQTSAGVPIGMTPAIVGYFAAH